jgi:hypothetical protein
MGPLQSEKILRSNTIFLICLVAFIPVHLIGIEQHGFWGDEAITASVSLLPLKKLIANRLEAGHFPTYFIIIKYWGKIFGTSEASLRFPSLLFMAAAFGGLWQFSRRFLSAMPVAALLFLFLFFFNPTVFRLSQEARMYGPLLCTTLFSSYYFLVYLEKGSSNSLVLNITFMMMSLALHAQGFILLAVQLLYLLLRHREKLGKYLLFLSLPLLIFLIVWQSGSSNYKVDRLPPSFNPIGFFTVLARAGMFAAGETDAFIFRIPPWSNLVVVANILFAFFLASCLHWLAQQTNKNIDHDKTVRRQAAALYYLLFLLASYFLVMVILGVLDIRAAHRVRYFITIIPYIFIIIAVGIVHLGEFLQSAWHGFEWLVYGSLHDERTWQPPWPESVKYVGSRIFGGIVLLVFAFLYSYAVSLQLHWKGPGYKEAILLLKENYRENEPVITCCMPKMQYGFIYFGAGHITKRLQLPRMKSIGRTRLRIKNITGSSDRVWFLFYRDFSGPTDPVLQAFNGAYPNYSIFLDRKYPVARLIGYEKTEIPYDPDDPLGFKRLNRQDNFR